MRVILLLICILAAGCASDVANRYYSNMRYPAKDPKEVQLLTKKPARDFIVIADFQSRGESAKALQKKAALIGADAVIVTLLGGYASTSSEWAGDDPFSNTYSRIIGTAIKFK